MSALPLSISSRSRSPGAFVWYELTTTDAEAATRFYQAVLGWGARDVGLPDMRYVLLTAGDTMVGGMMELPQDRDCVIAAPPGWIGYVAVDDIDTMIGRIDGSGGTVHRPAIDIPDIGRFAIVGDPQGAVFALFQGMSSPPPGPTGWHELHTLDPEGAFPFYASLFGWTKTDGTGQFFTTGGNAADGILRRIDPPALPFWLHHFDVSDSDAAVETIRNAGGRILHGPRQIPDGRWIVQGQDPQDIPFAVVSPLG
ncbi:VOC family protein [Gluconacetobacter azotocaptans]|uniref:VOC family protein n=1 Tax=Gluconacetobacter azotocaptans TaxID=142834 RepID=A0A7W4PEW5_9PROT|nr:VOC family protein [Gluconacetobacter azotocaptans]MBB2191742.1 VOC family protein [Gluconacetobacter azotocaptans]MBM9400992.1 VOC family protein [Gluconacetobacter azotocaptans]GBQ34202.1 glyoxalase [Gluconacetobacter azotocaptans DSM 13594]